MRIDKFFYALVLLVFLLVSCDTTSSTDGELDNFWYLTEVDTLSNGVKVNYRTKKVFWSFQGKLLQVEMPGNGTNRYFFKFNYSGDMLTISSPYFYNRVDGDEEITEEKLDRLRPFGVNAVKTTYSVESLNSSRMVLKDSLLRLTFEKY